MPDTHRASTAAIANQPGPVPLRNNSASLAILAAMLRASSRVSQRLIAKN
jgi:hypothetical protein